MPSSPDPTLVLADIAYADVVFLCRHVVSPLPEFDAGAPNEAKFRTLIRERLKDRAHLSGDMLDYLISVMSERWTEMDSNPTLLGVDAPNIDSLDVKRAALLQKLGSVTKWGIWCRSAQRWCDNGEQQTHWFQNEACAKDFRSKVVPSPSANDDYEVRPLPYSFRTGEKL